MSAGSRALWAINCLLAAANNRVADDPPFAYQLLAQSFVLLPHGTSLKRRWLLSMPVCPKRSLTWTLGSLDPKRPVEKLDVLSAGHACLTRYVEGMFKTGYHPAPEIKCGEDYLWNVHEELDPDCPSDDGIMPVGWQVNVATSADLGMSDMMPHLCGISNLHADLFELNCALGSKTPTDSGIDRSKWDGKSGCTRLEAAMVPFIPVETVNLITIGYLVGTDIEILNALYGIFISHPILEMPLSQKKVTSECRDYYEGLRTRVINATTFENARPQARS